MIRGWAGILLMIAIVTVAYCDGLRADLPDELTLSIEAGGRRREVQLHKYSIRAGRFRVRLWHRGRGYVTAATPEVTTYRGTVTDEPNTRVCAVINPQTGLTIYAHAGKTPIWRVTNEQVSPRLLRDPAEVLMPDDEVSEEVMELPAAVFLAGVYQSGQMPPAGTIQRAQMALDIANEHMVTKYSGDWTEALSNLEFTVNRYDDFMVRDTKMSFELTEVVVRMDQFYGGRSGITGRPGRTISIGTLPVCLSHRKTGPASATEELRICPENILSTCCSMRTGTISRRYIISTAGTA